MRVTGLYEENPPVTGGFPSQRTSNAENGSIWWRHHEIWVDVSPVSHDGVIKWKHFPCYWAAICAGNSPLTGEFPSQRPVTQHFDVLFGLRLNERLSKQWWGWCFEAPSRPLWRHNNAQEPLYNHDNTKHIYGTYTICIFCMYRICVY